MIVVSPLVLDVTMVLPFGSNAPGCRFFGYIRLLRLKYVIEDLVTHLRCAGSVELGEDLNVAFLQLVGFPVQRFWWISDNVVFDWHFSFRVVEHYHSGVTLNTLRVQLVFSNIRTYSSWVWFWFQYWLLVPIFIMGSPSTSGANSWSDRNISFMVFIERLE